MASKSSDNLMYITYNNIPIPCECVASLSQGDTMTNDFKAGSFFEVEGFDFGLKASDEEIGSGGTAGRTGGAASQGDGRFKRWRGYKGGNSKDKPEFRVDADELQISRRLDKASPTLLQYCLELRKLDKAVIVKRRRVGNSLPYGVMKLTMTEVTLHSVSWDDDEVMTEKCVLNFQNLVVVWCVPDADGKPTQPYNCEWHRSTTDAQRQA